MRWTGTGAFLGLLCVYSTVGTGRHAMDLLSLPSQLQMDTTAVDINQLLLPTAASTAPVVPAALAAAVNYNSIGITAIRQVSLAQASAPGLPPTGSYELLSSPGTVKLTMAATNIDLRCSGKGIYQGPLRWVLLKERRQNSQDFVLVANGSQVFDSAHYKVLADVKTSRLRIRNLIPERHFGTYQCQVSLPGNGGFIETLDFTVGHQPPQTRNNK